MRHSTQIRIETVVPGIDIIDFDARFLLPSSQIAKSRGYGTPNMLIGSMAAYCYTHEV